MYPPEAIDFERPYVSPHPRRCAGRAGDLRHRICCVGGDVMDIDVGATIRVVYPFVRCKATVFDCDGPAEIDSWKPGVEYVLVYPDDSEAVAHGLGFMYLTVVSVHKPGRYPTRVFFTRQFERPDGKRFGRNKLHIATAEKFKRLARGYQHEYRLIVEARAA